MLNELICNIIQKQDCQVIDKLNDNTERGRLIGLRIENLIFRRIDFRRDATYLRQEYVCWSSL